MARYVLVNDDPDPYPAYKEGVVVEGDTEANVFGTLGEALGARDAVRLDSKNPNINVYRLEPEKGVADA